MTFKSTLLPALAILALTASVRAQFTPGSGGYTPIPMPVAPTPPQPVMPPPAGAPAYSWQAPPAPPVAAAQPADPNAAVRILPGATYYDPNQYIQTPQGLVPKLSDAQVGDLTASVALYPDPLLSEMLPAATYVEQLTYADKWMAQHPGADEASIQSLPLDDSVKSVMHYPTVLSMLVDHLDWTQALGLSFQYQRNDVMDSIQRWRVTAVRYGTLASSPQLDVLQQGNIIEIMPPPNQQVIYVPTYDPQVVFVRPLRPLPRNVISFGGGGVSLSFVFNDVDWHGHDVHVPVHHDDHPGPDHHNTVVVGGGGRPDKVGFVHDSARSVVVYPDKIITPTDKKVITVIRPDAHDRGDNGRGPDNGRGNGRGPDNGRGQDNGRGGQDNGRGRGGPGGPGGPGGGF